MAYGTYSEVTALVPESVAWTVPTQAQIENWLDQYSAVVDTHLAFLGYATIPAVETRDVLLFSLYVTQKVAALTERAGNLSDNTTPKAEAWEADWVAFIESLKGGQIALVGQTPTVGSVGMIYFKREEIVRGSDWT